MKGFKKGVLIVCTLLLLLVFPTSIARASDGSYESLKGTNPSDSYEDLMFLKDELKGKTVVGVGEATHGTGSFFQFKDRLFRFLVEEMGFRAFAIEVQMSFCNGINEYVQTGEGNIEGLIEVNTSVFATKELLELVKWMREYNKTATDSEKVRFYGFDIQDTYSGYLPFEDYYKSINSGYFEEVTAIKESDFNLFSKVLDDLKTNKDKYIKASSPKEYDFIEKLAYNKKLSNMTNISYRDEEMKNNILWIQNYEKKYYNNDKVMLWAHNSHITKEENTVYYMGNLLSKELGNHYYAIGFDFYSGRFNTADNSRKPVGLGVTQSNENVFSGKIHSIFPDEEMIYFKVDKAINDPKIKEIFTEDVNMYNVGWKEISSMNFLHGSPCNIKNAYDGVVYFKNTFESNYISSNRQPKTYKMLDINEKSILLDENTLVSKILSVVFMVLGCYLSIIIWKKSFKDKSLDGDELKGRKILGFLIMYSIISDIISIAFAMVEGTIILLVVLGVSLTFFVGINVFKGKKWAKNIYFIYTFISIVFYIFLMILISKSGDAIESSDKLGMYISIISGISTIMLLRLKCVRSYFNYCNPKKIS